jgi:hypothetical protein
MKKHASTIAIGIFAALWFALGIYWLMSQPKHGVVVYDCRLSEISPDYPVAVKEQCRKANSGRL